MKLLGSKLYMSLQEAVEAGLSSQSYLRKAKSVGAKCWDLIDDPDDKRRMLVGYDTLGKDHKKKVIERFGDPYQYVVKTPILQLLEHDVQAELYYKQYRYGSGLYLPANTVRQYCRSVSWLTLINKVQRDKKLPARLLGIKHTLTFYEYVSDLIEVEKARSKDEAYTGIDVLPGNFPASYQRVLNRANEYAAKGYDCLISHMLDNKHRAKIGKVVAIEGDYELIEAGVNTDLTSVKGSEFAKNTPKKAEKKGGYCPELAQKQEAVLRHWCGKHQNLDAAAVTKIVNSIFQQNGWETLSRAAVYRYMSKNKHVLTPGRQGKRAYEDKVAMQISRKATTAPLDYLTLDAWTVELSYRVPGPNGGGTFGRLVACVVMDVFEKYPLGYAIGAVEDTKLIRKACRNAMEHIKELFGDYYRPWQLQSDHFQISNLQDFYQAMAKLYTPAAVGNAKAKVVEPYFRYLNTQYCQKFPNWTGYNLNSRKENQVNREMTDKIKHSFPDKQGVEEQVRAIVEYERQMKRNAYLTAWDNVPIEERLPMDSMSMIEVFGEQIGSRTVKVVGQGLMKTIEGQQYVWDSFDPAFRANMHIDWTIYAIPEDMSRALAVSPDKRLKFVLEEKRVLPMDARHMSADDWQYYSAVQRFNKENRDNITEMYGNDAEVTHTVMANSPVELSDDAELALKIMWTQKGQQKHGIQAAKGLMASAGSEERQTIEPRSDWEQRQITFRKERTDLSIYHNEE